MLPPLNALKAFETVARRLSFSRAADEMHVTPAALSHQIKGLEEFLGVQLFLRKARSIELTEEGRLLYPGVSSGFAAIADAVERLQRRPESRVLVVSSPPGITAKWLAPRLYRFLSANPEIDARISASGQLVDFARDGVDVAVRSIASAPSSLHSDHLMDDWVTPVVSPRLLSAGQKLKKPEDLARFPLIHDESALGSQGMPTWKDWLAAAGVADRIKLDRGLRFNSADHAVDAAVEGAGVLLARKVIACDEIRTGRLLAPFDLRLPANRSIFVVCPLGSEDKPKVAAFRSWIMAEARAVPDFISPAG